MQLKVPQFRHFIKDYMMVHHHPRWLEMAMGAEIPDKVPLSPQLAVLLSFIRGGDTAQDTALHWISNEGLYLASKGRQEVAKIASQKMGREVKEDEVFSPEAHRLSKEHGENPNLEDLWNNELQHIYAKYEPESIPVGKGHVVHIADLNKVLQKRGFKPFKFGGPDGYLEWIENSGGNYANNYFTDPHMTDGPGGGAAHRRNGPDLSKAKRVQYPGKEGSFYYTFGEDDQGNPLFVPPPDATHYKRTLDLIRTASRQAIGDIMAGKDSPYISGYLGTPEEAQEFKNWITSAQIGKTTLGTDVPKPARASEAKKVGAVAGKGRPNKKPQDPALVARFLEVLKKGLEVIESESGQPWGDEWNQKIWKRIVLDGEKPSSKYIDEFPDGYFNSRYTKPGDKGHNQSNVSAVLNAGLKALGKDASYLAEPDAPEGESTLDQFYSVQGDDYRDYTKAQDYEEIPVDIEKLKQQGFTPASGNWNTNADTLVVHAGDYAKSKKSYKLKKKVDGWYILN